MDDELWHLVQQSNRLQTFRQEIQARWADEAARQLNMRYLNPHEADSSSVIEYLVQHSSGLTEATAKLSTFRELSLHIETLMETLGSQVEYCEQDVVVFHQLHEQYREYHTGARALFPSIEELINRANALCNGVPTS